MAKDKPKSKRKTSTTKKVESTTKSKRIFSLSAIKNLKRKPKISVKRLIIGSVVLACLMVILGGWLWWTQIFINPDRVFKDAISNSLQTTSITRNVQQGDTAAPSRISQTSYISFLAPTITSESSSTVTQKGSQRKEVSVTTQTIATNKVDYVRYSEVNGAENLPGAEAFKSVVGVWAKREADPKTGQQSAFLNDSLFSVVPFGNFNNESKIEMLDLINQLGLYNMTEPAKREIDNYRPVYVYNMTIKPEDLIKVLAEYAKLSNAVDRYQLDPAAYKDSPLLSIQVTVDIAGRYISKIGYNGTQRLETYTGHNLVHPINFPNDTITFDELQKKIEQAGGGS